MTRSRNGRRGTRYGHTAGLCAAQVIELREDADRVRRKLARAADDLASIGVQAAEFERDAAEARAEEDARHNAEMSDGFDPTTDDIENDAYWLTARPNQ